MKGVLVLSHRPLSRGSVLRSCLEWLSEHEVPVAVSVVTDAEPLPAAASEAGLLVLRDVPTITVEAIANAERQVPCCNDAPATGTTEDKYATNELLRAARVPVPAFEIHIDWAGVRAAAESRPLAVKPLRGRDGTGVLLARRVEDLPETAPYLGPYLVQELINGNGIDRKLYVVDQHVVGVLRRWPAETIEDKYGSRYVPTSAERAAALAAGSATGLHVFGVDLVGSPDDPLVVDVNAMPGFKGAQSLVPNLSKHLYAHVTETAVATEEVASCG